CTTLLLPQTTAVSPVPDLISRRQDVAWARGAVRSTPSGSVENLPLNWFEGSKNRFWGLRCARRRPPCARLN
ncbi:hypothetical protein A2U01_0060084, partial [Trifolium medium]|nr:hypothetical protein [Trifolium medium]